MYTLAMDIEKKKHFTSTHNRKPIALIELGLPSSLIPRTASSHLPHQPRRMDSAPLDVDSKPGFVVQALNLSSAVLARFLCFRRVVGVGFVFYDARCLIFVFVFFKIVITIVIFEVVESIAWGRCGSVFEGREAERFAGPGGVDGWDGYDGCLCGDI